MYSDYVVIKMANKHSNSYNCTNAKSDEFLRLNTNTTGGNRMYSALLSAQVAKKKVKMSYSLCAAWGSTTIPNVYNVTLVD